MTKLEYTIKKGAVPDYQLELMRSGHCKALLPGSYYVESDDIHIICDLAGTVSLYEMLSCSRTELLAGFKQLLKIMRRIIEASAAAEGYLLDSSKLSFRADDIYFNADDGRARLIIKPGGESLADQVFALCGEIRRRCPSANADVLSERIMLENSRGLLSSGRMLRLLSSWEFELGDPIP